MWEGFNKIKDLLNDFVLAHLKPSTNVLSMRVTILVTVLPVAGSLPGYPGDRREQGARYITLSDSYSVNE